MSKFVMKNRPKKPSEPRTITMEVGNYTTLGYFLECVEKFKTENPDRSEREIMLSIEDTDWGDRETITLNVGPEGQKEYEAKKEKYLLDFGIYRTWMHTHKKEIAKWKAAEKNRVAKRKLVRTQDRLTKELAGVKAKLEKA